MFLHQCFARNAKDALDIATQQPERNLDGNYIVSKKVTPKTLYNKSVKYKRI